MDMSTIYKEFCVKTDEQKNVLNELVFQVISSNPKISGYTLDKHDDIRKSLYGDYFGSLQEKVLGVAGYWGNDLEIILADSLGLDVNSPDIFKRLFVLLDGKEVIDGVCFKN